MDSIKFKTIAIIICEFCLRGEGEVCHTPGCIFCRKAPPDWGFDERMYDELDSWDEETDKDGYLTGKILNKKETREAKK